MVEFLEQHGAEIVSMILALAGLATAVFNFRKTVLLNRAARKDIETTRQDITITREGIVEAFKSAKIPNEWKIDVSNKIVTTLGEWRDSMLADIKKNQQFANDAMLIAVKILSFTAASEKLSDEDKAKLDEIIRLVEDKDKTIEIE